MKRFIVWVLIPAFLSMMIAPDFASAASVGSVDLAEGAILLGGAIVVGLIVYGIRTLAGGKEKPADQKKPEGQTPDDGNKGIENVQPKSENMGLEPMRTAQSEEHPITPSGELVLLKW